MIRRPVVASIAFGLFACIIVAGAFFMHAALSPGALQVTQRTTSMPPFRHVFLIIAENQGYRRLIGHPELAPNINQLAAEYALATQFYAEIHPSEGNYVAMLGGDTLGIRDDDPFYCRSGLKANGCHNSDQPNYADHQTSARSLMEQLSEKGLSWKAYLQDFPSSAPLSPFWPAADTPSSGVPNDLYASKHNGFLNFTSVNRENREELGRHFSGFDQLQTDLASGVMPNFAEIIPNQCNDMHGLAGPNVPPDCQSSKQWRLVHRGDAEIGMLVKEITASRVWNDGNVAIVITFDESDGSERSWETDGCCGSQASSAANPGGGHIVTIVIGNHGPRHFSDPTPYNHYSLLRTLEAAFGISENLGHAADSAAGVTTMAPLFAVSSRT